MHQVGLKIPGGFRPMLCACCVLRFIAPPSLEALEKRLRSRGTETEESAAKLICNSWRDGLSWWSRISNASSKIGFYMCALHCGHVWWLRRKSKLGFEMLEVTWIRHFPTWSYTLPQIAKSLLGLWFSSVFNISWPFEVKLISTLRMLTSSTTCSLMTT